MSTLLLDHLRPCYYRLPSCTLVTEMTLKTMYVIDRVRSGDFVFQFSSLSLTEVISVIYEATFSPFLRLCRLVFVIPKPIC